MVLKYRPFGRAKTELAKGRDKYDLFHRLLAAELSGPRIIHLLLNSVLDEAQSCLSVGSVTVVPHSFQTDRVLGICRRVAVDEY